MSGKFSRDKGARGERALVNYFQQNGYQSYRVPLSGASEGYPGDVIVKSDTLTAVAELKCRKDAFKSIYGMLDQLKSPLGLVLCDNLYATVSYSFFDLQIFNTLELDFRILNTEEQITYKRAIKKIRAGFEYVGEADFLVLKNDYKPYIFICYNGRI